MKNQKDCFFSLPASVGYGDSMSTAEKSIKMNKNMRNKPNFQNAKSELKPLFNNN
jgi:hypothetical protein